MPQVCTLSLIRSNQLVLAQMAQHEGGGALNNKASTLNSASSCEAAPGLRITMLLTERLSEDDPGSMLHAPSYKQT